MGRAAGLRRLGDNDNARRHLAQKHAELALEHERTRNELAAAGLDPSGKLRPPKPLSPSGCSWNTSSPNLRSPALRTASPSATQSFSPQLCTRVSRRPL